MCDYEYTKYKTRNPIVQRMIQRFYNEIKRIMEKLEYTSLLDAGCGDGEALVRLQHILPRETTGIDIDVKQIDIAKSKISDVKFEVRDLMKLPYLDDSFDLVICLEVLEHVANPESILSEIARVSAKHLIISVPNEPYFMLGNLLRGKNISRLGDDAQHINHWSHKSFKEYLSRHVDVISEGSSFPWLIAVCKKKHIQSY